MHLSNYAPTLTMAVPLRLVRSFHSGMRFLARHSGSYTSKGTAVDTGEITSENYPWSPTLYTDRVYVKNGFLSEKLLANFRLSYEPMYEAPSIRYVSLLKRMTLGFAIVGIYGSKLLYDLVQFDDIYAAGLFLGTLAPAVAVNYKLKDYVTRVFRLYDKSKPQDLEFLTSREQLVIEKLTSAGNKTYNTLMNVLNNKALQLAPRQSLWRPYATWVDESDGDKRGYYISDNIGGMKMDRLWGIVEHNSDVNNGRYMEDLKE